MPSGIMHGTETTMTVRQAFTTAVALKVVKKMFCVHARTSNYIQSTLVISNSKGPAEIRLKRLKVRDILKLLWKKGEILFHNIFLPVVRFSCLGRDPIFTSR